MRYFSVLFPLIISTLIISIFPIISTPFLANENVLIGEEEDFEKLKSLY